MTASPRGDATEVPVSRVAVPKTGQKTLFATPGYHWEASRRGCRVEVRPKHRQEIGLRLVGRCFGTCPCPRSTSVDGPRVNVPIEAPPRHARMPLRYL